MLGSAEVLHRLRLLRRGLSARRISSRRLLSCGIAAFTLVAALAGLRLVYAGAPAEPGMRVLDFPADRSMGSLYMAAPENDRLYEVDFAQDPWEYVGQAQGRV